MTWLAAMIALLLAAPDRSTPERKPFKVKPRPPVLVVGHGFAVWEHSDGSCEMLDGRTVYSGVFIAGPRRNWWPDGKRKEVKR